jgi:hypothetical protein
MAIQPIDLQTLFAQMDKVGKNQAAQRDGLAIQQALQGIQMQRKAEEHIQSVNEAQNTGEGSEKVNDREKRGQAEDEDGGEKKDPKTEAQENAEKEDPLFIRDPALGRNIDISG